MRSGATRCRGEARTWLEYRAKEGMICTVCRSHSKDKRNSFIVGCPTMKLESITFHESSKSHRDSMTISQAKSQPIPSNSNCAWAHQTTACYKRERWKSSSATLTPSPSKRDRSLTSLGCASKLF